MDYDIILVGSGPSSLSFAQVASHYKNKKILIIESASSVGGCHSVQRHNNLFSEHGPRVYSSSYKTFIDLLSKMNIDFYSYFAKYNYPVTSIGENNIYNVLSLQEYFILTKETILLFYDENYGTGVAMKEFLEYNDFSSKSKKLIDTVCRLTDGTDISKYTLNQFLNLFNQNILYSFYQPKEPNDIGLMKKWKEYLEGNGVTFLMDSKVTSITEKSVILQDSTVLTSNLIIVGIPPVNLINILNNSEENIKEAVYKHNNFNNYNDLVEYAAYTNYNTYINITFHWDTLLELPKIHGFPDSEWGVSWIVLSDYFETDNTIISLSISLLDSKSSNTQKTANETENKQNLIDEAFNQLKIKYKDLLKDYKEAIVNAEYIENKWSEKHTAFVKTKYDYLKSSTQLDSLFILGTHNGNNYYKFTSIESAVSNGVILATKLFPETSNNYKVIKFIDLKLVVIYLIIFIVLLYIFI